MRDPFCWGTTARVQLLSSQQIDSPALLGMDRLLFFRRRKSILLDIASVFSIFGVLSTSRIELSTVMNRLSACLRPPFCTNQRLLERNCSLQPLSRR